MEDAASNPSTSSSKNDDFFTNEDLKGLLGWNLGTGFLVITCGCTSTMGYGDFVASLRITQQGDLTVVCNCLPGACNKGPLTPIKFEKHARNDRKKWKDSIWVTMFQGTMYTKKVPLCNTVLLRYYKSRSNNLRMHHVNVHRDEFLRCSACGKERRFKLRSEKECSVYRNAARNPNWVCGDFAESEINCEMEEERASRKVMRGCPKLINCEGCLSCVCTGCDVCMSA